MTLISFLEKIIENNWIVFILTFFGILVSTYGIKNMFRYKRISYREHRIEVNHGILCGMENNCNRRNDKVYVTQYAIWNSGTKYINDIDIAKGGPLKVKGSENCRLLDCYVVYQNNPVNIIECTLDQKKNEAVINFDFLDEEDGMVLNIVSEGKPEETEISVFIKGGRELDKSSSVFDKLVRWKFPVKLILNKIVGWIIVFWGLVMCPIAFLQSANYYPIKNNFFGVEGRMALVVDFLLIGSLIIYSACSTLPILISIFSARMPKNLKEYFYN